MLDAETPAPLSNLTVRTLAHLLCLSLYLTYDLSSGVIPYLSPFPSGSHIVSPCRTDAAHSSPSPTTLQGYGRPLVIGVRAAAMPPTLFLSEAGLAKGLEKLPTWSQRNPPLRGAEHPARTVFMALGNAIGTSGIQNANSQRIWWPVLEMIWNRILLESPAADE